jgi:hypothetical protein
MVNQHDIRKEKKRKNSSRLIDSTQKGRREKMIVTNAEQKKRTLFNET